MTFPIENTKVDQHSGPRDPFTSCRHLDELIDIPPNETNEHNFSNAPKTKTPSTNLRSNQLHEPKTVTTSVLQQNVFHRIL
ncbi:hypothetical protein T265_10221 [Opisthorchis viverrini]|uniref:Uncharacterized protein n=1 Tax=Opisthorchis viverrini TaxID=6198 RepID=A0A074Z317_OPIVI|nr:hypothetical protein T265_10221 [Opisthorchis viverrini]KER21461.1 hypothetical protein T265_10221 [Opisthorchis viverrini]